MDSLRRQCIAGLALLCLTGSMGNAAPSVIGTLVSTRMVGDVNGDGIADYRDLAIAQANLGKTGTLSQGDVNGDGTINSTDVSLITQYNRVPQIAAYYGKITDSTSIAPGGTANFYMFNAPSMDRTGNLAFFGNALSYYGIYRYSSGSVLKVVDSNTAVPSGNGSYTALSDPAIVGTKILFNGSDTNTNPLYNGSPGIYSSVNGATPTVIVNKNTARPEGGTFSSFTDLGDPRAAGTLSIFTAGSAAGVSAIYGANGTTLTKVVDLTTYLPGSTTTKFTSLSEVGTDGTNYYFVGTGSNQYGLYKKSGSTISTMVDGNTAVPGTSYKLTYLSSISNDGANFSFFGTLGGFRNGVFALIGSALNKIADTTTAVPGGKGNFSSFGASSVGGSAVAFIGSDASSRPGIYAWVNGQLVRVIDTSVELEGKMISGLEMSNHSVVSNKVTFKATFTDGSSGLYVASIMAPWASGDLNGDGKVDKSDFAALWRNLGRFGTRSTGDLDGDGKITLSDLQLLERYSNLTGSGPLLGDVDGNGKVDSYDARMVLKNLGKYGGPAQGDFNLDGQVTLSDLQIVEAQLGKTGSAFNPFGAVTSGGDVANGFTAVPEPAGLAMFTLAGAIVLMRRKRD